MEQSFEKVNLHSWSNLWKNRHSFVIFPLFSRSEPFCQDCDCGICSFLPSFIGWVTARDLAFSFSSLFKLHSPILSIQPLPRASPTSFPKLLSPTSPSPSASYLYEFQLASFFHSIFPAYQSCPTEFDCDLAMYLPCQPSDPCWRQQGIQMIPLREPTVFKPAV